MRFFICIYLDNAVVSALIIRFQEFHLFLQMRKNNMLDRVCRCCDGGRPYYAGNKTEGETSDSASMKADAAPDPDFCELRLKDAPVFFFMPLEFEQLWSQAWRTKRCGKSLGAVYVHCTILACMIDFDHLFGN